MPKISIIVPVYNVELYLRRCLDSILSQTFTDFELLLVDDGSIDGSGSICDEYKLRDSRVRVFHKVNGGVSSARNLALDNAVGEWIAFVDGDDWIEPSMYDELYNKALNENADVVYSDFMMRFCDRKEYSPSAVFFSEKNEMMRSWISSVWTCLVIMLVKRNLYEDNKLRFPTHLSYCEDFWLSVRLFHFSKKISYLNKAFYNYYRANENSRVNNMNAATERNEQDAYLDTIEFFRANNLLEVYEKELSWRVLKSKQELVLNKHRHKDFLEIYPNSHKYILSCPYINCKIKMMMWLLSNRMSYILLLILKIRKIIVK